jgi:hypothetical protein
MRHLTISEQRPRSKEYAIAQGLAHGGVASELFMPPDMFEEVLKITMEEWRVSGCHAAWIAAGEEAARAAYRPYSRCCGPRLVSLCAMSSSLKSCRIISDLDIYRTAKLLIDRHGAMP